MTKSELEALLREFDEALVQAFPGPEPMSVLLVGGACLLLQGITAQPVDSVDIIILEMLGSPEPTLVFHSPIADKIRRIIREIGRRHGLKGERQQFLNDDAALFLLELSEYELPPMRLLKAYRKLHLYTPRDLDYLLPCARRLRSRTGHRRSRLWTGTFLPLLCRPPIGCPAHWRGCSGSDRKLAYPCCQTLLALLCCARHRFALIRLR